MASSRTFSVGIDIGTNQVKVIVADHGEQKSPSSDPQIQTTANPQNPRIKILGIGTAESRGIRHGYITNMAEATKSIKQAIAQASKNSQVSIKRAFVSINGIGLGAIIATAGVSTTKADAEITDLDVKRAIEESEKEIPAQYIQNRKIIHTIPLEFKIDGKKVLGKPQGLKGIRLETRVLYVTYLSHHLTDILTACEEADVEVQDVIAGPMAASFVTLQKSQKIAGCLLANIGSETTSIIVFENNIPISLEVFPFGSTDITNDIALGLRVGLEDAELIKRNKPADISFSKKKLDEIVVARLADIFDLIDDHLRKIDRSGLLPAGVILTGGGSALTNIEDFARIALHLPARKANIDLSGNIKQIASTNEWTTAYGLAIAGLGTEDSNIIQTAPTTSLILKLLKRFWNWLKQFLP